MKLLLNIVFCPYPKPKHFEENYVMLTATEKDVCLRLLLNIAFGLYLRKYQHFGENFFGNHLKKVIFCTYLRKYQVFEEKDLFLGSLWICDLHKNFNRVDNIWGHCSLCSPFSDFDPKNLFPKHKTLEWKKIIQTMLSIWNL